MQQRGDTICAVATPPGRGGVGIVRVSGAAVPEIASRMFGSLPQPRLATHRVFKNVSGEVLDEGLVIYFQAPHSFTGEEVLEFHGHGGPVVLDRLVKELLFLGARLARPGEFSERAFLNDKFDLAQAEAIADLIAATTEQGAKAALRSLQGEFSDAVNALVAALTELRVYVESAIDFPEEEIDFLSEGHLEERLSDVTGQLLRVQRSASRGQILRDGMSVVIAGRPNAGKSSLLNRLAGRDVAIVTDVPGTTRDPLKEQIHIDGMPLHVIDTAGLRESGDAVEREGIRRAWGAIQEADRVLLVADATEGIGDPERRILRRLMGQVGITIILNKVDLTTTDPGFSTWDGDTFVAVSAKTGAGLDTLCSHLKQCMDYREEEGAFIARRRHLDAIDRAARHLQAGRLQLTRFAAGELLAEELRLAQQALSEITGEVTSEDLLSRIFSSFCIGK